MLSFCATTVWQIIIMDGPTLESCTDGCTFKPRLQGKSIEGCTIKSWMKFRIVHSLSFYLRDVISYLAWTPRRAELRDKCFVQVFIIFTPFGISIHQCFCCNSCKHYYTVPADPSPNKTLRQTEIRFVYVYYQLESV
jgi:hypothetical protein